MKTALCSIFALGFVAVLAISADALGRDDGGKYKCVNLKDLQPCQDLPYANFPICDYCQLGIYAHCSETGLEFKKCPTVANYQGHVARLVYDPTIKACAERSPDCSTGTDYSYEGQEYALDGRPSTYN
ncbi:hypothetical protein EGW08_006434 [Elysia chlorotica]|uniref:Chitin-binding type-2 domain-containing protein n=1 Tax=Elysia chlorotica TaxID=188477 RepID=A0A3S1BKD8_ELYCH|nr:hypothetical protein EGW08_006434 [Elysia chlorotica]